MPIIRYIKLNSHRVYNTGLSKMAATFLLFSIFSFLIYQYKYIECVNNVPLVINTWAFTEATHKAWEKIQKGYSAIDALVAGCSECERLQCDGTVGYGGSPDENGETTLDAMVFDGATMDMGAVGALRNVKSAIAVAKHVLKYTTHSFLVGSQAMQFAKEMGFRKEPLSTNKSLDLWVKWQENKCQPNSWRNVYPNSKKICGPYIPVTKNSIYSQMNSLEFGYDNHDTIGMIVIDSKGDIAAGTSTNGKSHKIPGRVGDSPIPGAGAYAENKVGAATATGDGDLMMRFLPSFLAVEELRRGTSPKDAAQTAISRIAKYYPDYFGAIVVVDASGKYAAACNGMDSFKFSVANKSFENVKIIEISCK